MAALVYAGAFWDKVCHDGRVATKTGYPSFSPGLPLAQIGYIPHEEDCTHFISCCVGQGRGKIQGRGIEFRGGGLQIPSHFQGSGVYGETYTTNLVSALIRNGAKIIRPQFMATNDANTRAAIRQNLQPGDILAYTSSNKLLRDGTAKYEHMCILVGPDTIACHTTSRFAKNYTDITYPFVVLLKLP
jgi:hypothetical protein